ncbi:SLAM family member 9-like isoform X6 [Ctenopharyngodon idella]|uniref:SLAM family member 9-like isoform X6 n=1 Tax=Ctenopharyngodon idella TaxID=7959 RepID=UPI002232790E|nr:SLAM family member 9-like isoform X6 [Ctenopharyngodon idella]
MIHSTSFFGLFFMLLNGVFGDTDEVKSVSVMEGDSVTLQTNVTEVQRDDHILWTFGPRGTRIAEIHRQNIYIDATGTTFEKILQIDNQTGSLTIRNIRSEHTGLYKLQIVSNIRGTSNQRFSVTVYARPPVPAITRDSSDCSSSSSVSNCSLLCSAVNVSHVTLSWYKGNSLLSNISVSDLSISLSLPLEVEYQDNDTYSCVLNNPISNQTQHLDNITQLCQTHTCSEQRSSFMMAIALIAPLLLVVIAVVAGLIYHRNCKQPGNKVNTHDEEMHYAEPTFCTQPLQSMDVIAEDCTVYSTVVI